MSRRDFTWIIVFGCLVVAGGVFWLRWYFAPASASKNAPTPRQALGLIHHLPPKLRRAFTPTAQHPPLPRPRPGDWLAEHPEPGQTVAAFIRGQYNRPQTGRRTLVLVPVGPFPPPASPSLAALKCYTEAFFQLPVTVVPAVDPAMLRFKTRINSASGKPQILVGDILDYLRKRLRTTTFAAAGVTMIDLYPSEDWNFVFGQASLRGRVGAYSFARYDPAFDGSPRAPGYQKLILKRAVRVLNHETGHMFGLRHCIFFKCAMNGSNHLAEDDRTPLHLCPVCLRKLHYAIGFDVEKRYEALLRFYRDHGLKSDARWIEKRLAYVRGQ